jgi:hypothetical protein
MGRVSFPAGARDFLFSAVSRLVLEATQPPGRWVLGSFSQGVKLQECEADHSPTSIAEVKTGGSGGGGEHLISILWKVIVVLVWFILSV